MQTKELEQGTSAPFAHPDDEAVGQASLDAGVAASRVVPLVFGCLWCAGRMLGEWRMCWVEERFIWMMTEHGRTAVMIII